jgi:hypothetical protein
VQGGLDDVDKLSALMANCKAVISLLGPSIENRNIDPTIYANFYKALFPIMRQHNVRRILAMATISHRRPEDYFALLPRLTATFMWLFVSKPYRSIINVAAAFDEHASDLDWTIYRIALIPGGSDEASWKKDRDAGTVFSGWVGEKGWTFSTPRGALARWLVDATVEGVADKWIRSMPAIGLKG